MRYLLSIILFVFMISNSHALEIGVVDLNRALNESEEGMRSKNLLESRGRQKQQEFKVEEEELMQIAEDLRNNPLLTPKAKQEKDQELQNRQRILREKVRQFEQELRLEERKLTEAIFQDLKAAIRTVSQRSDYDLVLEKNAAQVILYMKEETTDLTQKIIDYYNSLKHQNNE
ncbi:MAG: hypothetical protein CL915_05590 [Deltaproteobacteria bacterium]|nr:hypothetical protein [Deltaproteobacteria bacterium]